MKRFLSILLVLCLVAAWLPAGALAQENEIPEQLSGSWINPLYADVIGPEDLPEVQIQPQKKSGGSAYYEDPASAAAVVREAMENRSASVSFGYMIPKDDYSNEGLGRIAGAILDYACAHTGVPTQGDYLTWQYGGASFGAQAYGPNGDGSAYYSDITFNLRYYTTAQQEATVTQAVKELLATLNPTGSDYQKLTTVYDWICDNIVYDYDNLYNDAYTLKYSAYAALINRTAVCQGYSLLLYRLALEMGIDCRIISGIGITNEGSGDHAWNILKVGGKYYNADATWDINFCANDDYRYYLLNEANFSPKHVRDAEYSSSAFFAAYPMGESDYVPGMENQTPPRPEEPEVPQIPSGTCGDNLTWKLEDGVLTISGTGAIDSYKSEAPWESFGDQIQTLVIEEGVTTIGEYNFVGLMGLTDIYLPASLEYIGPNAFVYGMGDNIENVYIPDLGAWCAVECANYYWSNPLSYAENLYVNGEIVTDLVIPEGTTRIGDNIFGSTWMFESLVIPESVTSIGSRAFFGCETLKTVTIHANLDSVGEYAFHMSGVQTVTFTGDAPADYENLFNFYNSVVTVYYPAANDTWDEVVAADLWNIEFIPGDGASTSGTCGDNLTWNLNEGVLTISGTGDMYDYEDGWDPEAYAAPWSGLEFGTVIIEEGVTGIGNNAFMWSGVNTVSIADSVTSIGEGAFAFCQWMTEVNLPANLTELGDNAFGVCVALKNVTIPGSVKTIGCAAFSGCEWLESVVIEEGVEVIGESAFSFCGMSSIVLPETITNIGMGAFAYCYNLKEITVPASVNRIGSGAFDATGDSLTITFCGSAPVFEGNEEGDIILGMVPVTCYYPAGDASWTAVIPTVHGSVTWISYGEEEIIPGDMDGDGVLDDKDVAQLLWHTLFPASFAICGDADFNHDGVVDDADVAYLLWHTLFPNAFPL